MPPTTKTTPIARDDWPPAGWLLKSQAAVQMNRSESRVAALAQEEGVETTPAKPLKSRKLENPKTKQVVTLIHAGDVESFLYRRKHPEEFTEVAEKPEKPEKDLQLIRGAALQPVAIAPQAPAAPRPWLTLDEAENYSGLPAGFLLEHIAAGKLPALNVGRRKGGQWRVARRDLDQLQATATVQPLADLNCALDLETPQA
jgi:hypothetical protein